MSGRCSTSVTRRRCRWPIGASTPWSAGWRSTSSPTRSAVSPSSPGSRARRCGRGVRVGLRRRHGDAAPLLGRRRGPGPRAADLDEGRRFPMCLPEPLARLWTDAGLTKVTVQAIEVPTAFPDFDHYWQPFLGGQGPAPGYVASLSEERRRALREHLRERLPSPRTVPSPSPRRHGRSRARPSRTPGSHGCGRACRVLARRPGGGRVRRARPAPRDGAGRRA